MVNLFMVLIVGAISGYLASQVFKSRYPWLLDMVIGIGGALLAGLLFVSSTFLTGDFSLTSLLWSFIGALVLLFVVKLFFSCEFGFRLGSPQGCEVGHR